MQEFSDYNIVYRGKIMLTANCANYGQAIAIGYKHLLGKNIPICYKDLKAVKK